MILKALYDYYHRCGDLPRNGMELKEIGYLIVIDDKGNFICIESRMLSRNRATLFNVLKAVKRSGKKYTPNYFWDNYEYVIGGDLDACKKQNTFIDLVEKYHKLLPANKYLTAVDLFYKNYINVEGSISADKLFEEVKRSNKNISFIIKGLTTIFAEDSEIVRTVLSNHEEQLDSICLVSGEKRSPARLHTPIKLTKDTGALVSFQKKSGYDSYGKEQAYNAPVSEDAEFAYTTALNHLLRSDSRNKFLVGDRTFVFWASNDSDAGRKAEESLWDMFAFSDSLEDDPNKRIEQVRKVFKSIYSGELKTSLDDKFYILGLAPNSARIAVTYWSEIPLVEFARRINGHFDDMEIVDGRKDKLPYRGLRSILAAVTLNGKSSEVTPNLPEAVVKSIFQGVPYPYSLYSGCIRRIRAESSDKNKKVISITRVAIIKGYLNRLKNEEQKIEVMLDKENQNQGYLCGRLFAVLDKIQDDANGQHSIKERYMNSASATPAAVFSTILNLSSHHSIKLSEGRRIFYEKLKQEIFEKISACGFPAHLDLQDQGRFFVGYYHQMQAFYTKDE